MDSLLAIVISIGSFVFTLYQWFITTRLKRPNLKLLFFNINKLSVYEDYKLTKFSLDTKDFMISNLSDLANSLIKIRIFCKLDKEWIEGNIQYEREFERMETRQKYISKPGEQGAWDTRNEVVRGKELVQPFPFVIQPHISTSFASYDIYGSFPVVIKEEDLDNLKIKVEIVDQYGKKHGFSMKRKHFPELAIANYPQWDDGKVIGKLPYGDENGAPETIAYTVYVPHEDPQQAALKTFHTSPNRKYQRVSVRVDDLTQKIAAAPGEMRIDYSDSTTPVTIILSGGKPQYIEVTLKEGDDSVTQRFPVPAAFQSMF